MASTSNINMNSDLLEELRAIPQDSLVELTSNTLVFQGKFAFFEDKKLVEIGNAVEVKSNTHYHRMQAFNLVDISSVRVVTSDMEYMKNFKDDREVRINKKTGIDPKDMEPVELKMETFVVKHYEQLKSLYKALRDIDFVGMSFEGENIGRFGKTTWIILCARKTIIPIDINSLNAQCPKLWDSLGRHIFNNQHLLKIVHDCRPISDYLYHAYKIKLVSVFDTQVADAVLRKVNDDPTNVATYRPLHALLKEYNFRIPDVEINYLKEFHQNYNFESNSPWLRPSVDLKFLKLGALKVKHLIPLRENLERKLLENFTKQVEEQLKIREKVLPLPMQIPEKLKSPAPVDDRPSLFK